VLTEAYKLVKQSQSKLVTHTAIAHQT